MPEPSRSSTTPGTARPRRTAAGSTGTRTTTSRRRPLLPVLPGAGPVLEQRPARRRAADGPDQLGGDRRGRRLLVGPRLDRGPAAAARDRRRRAGAASSSGSTSSPTRTARSRRVGAGSRVLRDARRPRRLRLPPARFPGRGLGGRDERRHRRRSGCSPAPSSSASLRQRTSTASTRTTSTPTAAASSSGSARRRTRMHLVCGPSVGPGLRRTPAPARRPASRPARARRDLRPALERRARRRRPTSSRSRATTSGGKERRSSRPRRGPATPRTTAPGA